MLGAIDKQMFGLMGAKTHHVTLVAASGAQGLGLSTDHIVPSTCLHGSEIR